MGGKIKHGLPAEGPLLFREGVQIPPFKLLHTLSQIHTDDAAAAAGMTAQAPSDWSAAWSSTPIAPLLRKYLL